MLYVVFQRSKKQDFPLHFSRACVRDDKNTTKYRIKTISKK